MMIQKVPDSYEKLQALGGMATDDVLSTPSKTRATYQDNGPYSDPKKNPLPGVYKASMPNGKTISLMRVMFTDFCKMDCFYCPNSHWVPRKRFAFKVEELAKTFMYMHSRHTVDGLFLSSGIAGDGSKTTEKLVKVVDMLRNTYNFKGYVHMKVMPGTNEHLVEAAHRLGTRLSVNIETPSPEHMKKISTMKNMEKDILAPMSWVHKLTKTTSGGAVGQATQMVVGAADETDADIFRRMDQLYTDWQLKRIYFVAFRPTRYTPLEEHPGASLAREHRLYQVDWLKRVYQFSNEELKLAFDKGGFLPETEDPKASIALSNLDAFPMDINAATKADLLRIPGVGPTSAERILNQRRQHKIATWRDLEAMGVVRKRAWPFVTFPGHKPPQAKQLRMDLFEARERRMFAPVALPAAGRGAAPCGEVRSCTGCPMFGAPGHPGSAGVPMPVQDAKAA